MRYPAKDKNTLNLNIRKHALLILPVTRKFLPSSFLFSLSSSSVSSLTLNLSRRLLHKNTHMPLINPIHSFTHCHSPLVMKSNLKLHSLSFSTSSSPFNIHRPPPPPLPPWSSRRLPPPPPHTPPSSSSSPFHTRYHIHLPPPTLYHARIAPQPSQLRPQSE